MLILLDILKYADHIEAISHQNCQKYHVSFLDFKKLYKNCGFLDEKDFKKICHYNPVYTGDDLSDYSFATIAIMIRLLVPTLMHIIGSIGCIIGFFCSIIGFVQKNGITVISAIFYIFGGLTVSMSVLQYVSIVDDEMQPRMKPNAAGEPSSFTYHYQYPFTMSALSFIPVQICIYLQTQMYFSRYPRPDDKTKAVPGLDYLRKSIIWLLLLLTI